jgi:glycosyltransferase involved in cell wall biosynthesis
MVRPSQLTVVVAVYRCAASLEELYRRGNAALQAAGHSAEWVFVDDASPDDAWCVLQSLCRTAKNVGAIRFERNAGQHAAIRAGIAMATTPWTAVIDGDLEDRPEFLVDLLDEAGRGHDVVCAATPSSYLLVFAAAGFDLIRLPSPVEKRKSGRSSYGLLRLAGTAARNLILFRRRLMLGILGAVLLILAAAPGFAGSSLPSGLLLVMIVWIVATCVFTIWAGRWTRREARSFVQIGYLTPSRGQTGVQPTPRIPS